MQRAILKAIAEKSLTEELLKQGLSTTSLDAEIISRAADELIKQYERGEPADYANALRAQHFLVKEAKKSC